MFSRAFVVFHHRVLLVNDRSPFRSEKLSPSAKLNTVRIPLRPAEALLAPLPGARDVLPNGRTIHTLTLTYKLNVAEAGKHTVTLPLLNKCAGLASLFSAAVI